MGCTIATLMAPQRRYDRTPPDTVGAWMPPAESKCLLRAAPIDRHEVVVTCLEQHSKAQPGRRTRWSPRRSRLVSTAVAGAFIVGPALSSARLASADQLQSAQAQAAQI